MNILVVPMFALSQMGGPWSRAQRIAWALEAAGHHVVLARAEDGNCLNPRVADTVELEVPSPLGLPMAVASRTFPVAQRLGIAGRKPVGSFEEVLWLTGNLAYPYLRRSVDAIAQVIRQRDIDAVYAEFSLPAIIGAKAAGVPVFGSVSYPTQATYASAPAKAKGVRRLLAELGLPAVESSLELFGWLDRRFVPSCAELEPFDDANTRFVGFLEPGVGGGTVAADTAGGGTAKAAGAGSAPAAGAAEKAPRDIILVYLGSGSVPAGRIERAVRDAFAGSVREVYVAGVADTHMEGNLHFAPRFDFSELLGRAACFVHHGGQNSTMDALAWQVPQVIVPGRVFERRYNGASIEKAGAGLVLEDFTGPALARAVERATSEPGFAAAAQRLFKELSGLGGAD
ncbi:MAG: hypothetical protein IKD70_06040, partial [Eggerthellaceae bacterium]|nr:hypothetical protein [Eggerthellaceae bacterium]